MRGVNKKQLFVLYALGKYLKEANEKFKDQPLEVSVSKINFIRMMRSADITKKAERSLYKNLELLEKKKLIHYENKFLTLTEKGFKEFELVDAEISPYLRMLQIIKEDISKYAKKAQARFK